MPEPATTERPVPTWTRRFVYGFLGALLVCGLASIEAWPFSAFKLFSAIRDGERESWQIVWVDPQDREDTISLYDLPVAYRNTTTLLREFESMSKDERNEVCDAWAQPLRERGRPVEHVRVYRRTTSLGDEPPPATRKLMWECGT